MFGLVHGYSITWKRKDPGGKIRANLDCMKYTLIFVGVVQMNDLKISDNSGTIHPLN